MKDETGGRVLVLSERDNVAVAVAVIEPGTAVTLAERSLTVSDRVPLGNKLAVVPIAAGEKIVKYGAPIGSATRDIAPGEMVHTHNMKSDYLPTYTRDGQNPYIK